MKIRTTIAIFIATLACTHSLKAQVVLSSPDSPDKKVTAPTSINLKPGYKVTAQIGTSYRAFIDSDGDGFADQELPPGTPSEHGPLQNFADTKGELSVSGMGAANYTLPIALPPGIKNIAPQISIVYNSTSDNGMAGYGWNVTGISSISRVATRLDIDGYVDGVNFNSDDKFSLDGQRLLIKTGNHGEAGATYQTENYSNLKIESIGSTTYPGIEGNRPEYFKVTFPDGTQVLYGSTVDSRGVTEWLIKKWKDPQGNFIEYSYDKDRNTTYISTITWGSNENKSTNYFNSIRFYYKSRARSEFAYVQGVKMINSRILDRVEVLAGGQLFKKYQLTHQTITGNYQRVASIQEFNSNNEPANPVTFGHITTDNSFGGYEYNKSEALWDIKNIKLTGDFDGDGQADVITKDGTLYKNLFENLGTGNNRISLQNVINTNGALVEQPITTLTNNKLNNFQSLVAHTKELPSGISNTDSRQHTENKLVLNTLNFNKSLNTFEKVYTKKIPYPHGERSIDMCSGMMYDWRKKDFVGDIFDTYNNFVSNKYLEGDFNGDGISELIVLGQVKYTWVDLVIYGDSSGGHAIPLESIPQYECDVRTENIGVASYYVDMNPAIPDDQSYHKIAMSSVSYDSDNYVIDIDGDGRSEVMSFSGSSYQVSALNKDKQFTVLFSGNISEYDGKKPLLVGDLNGDGKTDFMIPEALDSPHWYMYISTGKGLEKIKYENLVHYQPEWKGAPSANRYKARQYRLADLNKDGKADFIESEYESWTVSPGDRDGRGYIRYYENLGGGDKPYFGGRMEAEAPRSEYGYEDPFALIIADYKNNEKTGNFVFVQRNEIWKGKFNKDLRKDILLTQVSEAGGNIISNIEYASLEPNAANNELGDAGGIYFSSGQEVYPYREVTQIPNMDVVKKLSVTSAGKTLYQQYKYSGLVTHTRGLGLLGFKKTARSNWQTEENIVRTPVWSVQEMYPQLGRTTEEYSPLISSWSFKGGNFNLITNPQDSQLLSKSSVKFRSTQPLPDVHKDLPVYKIEKDFLTGVTVTTDNQYDEYGNLSRSVANNGVGTAKTDYTYENNPSGTDAQYYIGRLVQKSGTVTAYSDTYTTEEKYTYTGNQITQTQKKGHNTDYITETFAYDGFGNLIEKTVSAPGVFALTIKDEYDLTGRFVVKKTDADNLTETFTYNNWGQVLSHVSPLNVLTETLYDGWGKLRKVTTAGASDTPLVSITNYERTQGGGVKVTSYSDQTGDYSVGYKDVFGRDIKSTVKGFAQGTYISKNIEYDVLGRKTRESEPYFEGSNPGQWNTIEYDDLSRPIKQKLFTGKEVTNTYNGLSVTTKENNGVKIKTITKDANGNVVKVVDNGETVNYTYYANGNQKTSNYNGHIVTLKYDGWGRKTWLQDPSVSSTPYTYSYNNYGEILTQTTPDGTTAYTYSPTGKVLTKTVTGNNTNISSVYEYSNIGLLLKETGTSGGESYSYIYAYDGRYRLISHKETTPQVSYTREYTYDQLGRSLTEKTVTVYGSLSSSVFTQNVYNSYNGILEKVIQEGTGKILWQLTGMNARMQTLSAKLGNNVNIANTYDDFGFVKEVVHSGTVSTPLSVSYDFNTQRGILNSRNNHFYNWNEQFTYDNFDRLVSWSDPNGTNSNTYANDGRITTNSQVGNYNYDGSSRYKKTSINLNIAGDAYYSARPRQQITYNVYKNPVEITEGTNKVTFGYNIHASRTQAVVISGTTTINKFYSDDKGIEILSKTNPAGKEAKIITWISGSPYDAPVMYVTTFAASGTGTLQKTEDAFYYLHRDYQGTIMAISNEQGQTVERRLYDPWGKPIPPLSPEGGVLPSFGGAGGGFIDRGYTGHEHFFAVGLIHMNGRMYDPVLRQFLSPDNFIQDSSNSQNYNRYGYVLNNPLMYTDPTGEEIFTLAGLAVAAGIGALIGGAVYTAYALYTDTFSWKGFGKAILTGGATGALAGVAALYAPIGILPGAGYGAVTGGAIGMVGAGINGSDIIKGGIIGAVTGGIMGGISGGIKASKLGVEDIWTGTGTAKMMSEINPSSADANSGDQFRYANTKDMRTDYDANIGSVDGKTLSDVESKLNTKVFVPTESDMKNIGGSINGDGYIVYKGQTAGGMTTGYYKGGWLSSDGSTIYISPGIKSLDVTYKNGIFKHEFMHAWHWKNNPNMAAFRKYSEQATSTYSLAYAKHYGITDFERSSRLQLAGVIKEWGKGVYFYPRSYSWRYFSKIIPTWLE